ncbi:acyltransferase family protein [Leifsonia shinshuensis]|uniref:Peptidoglycan/LPS O-acetylase OafA/YrhL n=1 Tax=Leifsonia shinshuensis TaxID=150026 RepID=A0A853CVP7_9MICO|nr:acyltransferase family protein [Leifsonia shinshuensis]NYJ24003.1 peptidoglycan/LPS O-acetylase OafA/YrhL [Leifsonia shinshuensis]
MSDSSRRSARSTGPDGRRSGASGARFGQPGPAPTKFRLDLQGLRALAVGLVVLNHAFEWPAGGFVGVDIFFVISGFLMTSVLHREYERTGRIRFLAFYRRRIRRLIPASVAVLVATVVGAWALFTTGRFVSTAWDALASLFFVSNWRFAAVQTDYFAQGAQTSPLQHYWSLSLEEQYYLVWPAAILLIALVVARGRRPRVLAALITFAITVALFILSLQLTQADSATAYFITPARLWELSVGAAVALCMPWFSKLPAALRPAIALLALAGMVLASAITPSGAGFPAPWAALAVLSTAAFIAFPWQPKRSWLNPLDNPVLSYIGDISYSLYLWHFPALILVTELARGTSVYGTPLPAMESIALSIVLAALSYRFIEEPVRRSSWLEPQTRRRRRTAQGSRAKAIALGTVAAVTAGALVLAFTVDRNATRPEASAGKTASPAPDDVLDGGGDRAALESLSAGIKTALGEKSWPELNPSMDSVVAGYEHDPATHACAIAKYPGVESCTWGAADAPHSMAIVGDSTSVAYVAMLRALAEVSGGQLRFTALGMYSCPFVDLPTSSADPALQAACPARKELEIANLATLRPEVLFVTNAPAPYKNTETGKEISVAEYQAGLKRSIEHVASNVGKVVFLAAPPSDKDVRECYSPRTSPAECVTTVPDRWKTFGAADAKTAAAFDGVRIDSRPLFCVSDRCPAFADGIPIKFDSTHITDEYGRHIAPAVVALLAESGVSLTGGEATEPPPAS